MIRSIILFAFVVTIGLKVVNSDIIQTGNRTIQRVKLVFIADKNQTIKLRHNFIEGYVRFWTLIDPIANKSLNLATAFDTNVSYTRNNESELNYVYNMTKVKLSTNISHRIIMPHFEAKHGGKMILFSELSPTGNKKDRVIFETIAIKHSECSIWHPLNRNRPKSNGKLDHEVSKFIRLMKNQKVRFYCSIMIKIANDSSQYHPKIQWQIGKFSPVSNLSFGALNYTYFKLNSNESDFNYIFWSEIEYTTPHENLKAWGHHNEPIACQISYYNYNDSSLTLFDIDSGYPLTSNNNHSIKIPNLGCKFQLDIQFEPFIHPNVSSKQVFFEKNRSALIECPIKANSHFPIRYFI